jgi:hypothetical protein
MISVPSRKSGRGIGKEALKSSLFTDDLILYLKDPKDSTRRNGSDKKFQQNSWTQKPTYKNQ